MNPRALALLAVFLATLLTHAAARDGDYVFFDDGRFVVRNRAIDSVGDPWRFFADVKTTASPDKPTKDIYRPIRTLSFAVVTKLWGKQEASAFHSVAIVVHALAALLLAGVLMAAGCGPWPAAAGALFWGLHPVTVEVTAWVCSLGDAWCGLFGLAAILLYARNRTLLAHAALVVALFSKEHAVVVPGIWLAWDFFLRRERLARGLARGAIPGLFLVGGFLFFRSSLGVGMSQVERGPFFQSVLTMVAGLGWYLGTILLPYSPTFQARVQPDPVGVAAGLLVLGALVFALVRGSKRTRLASAWFLIALVPVSNIFVPLKIPTADRFLYLPLMGLALLGAQAVARRPKETAWAAPVALLLLAGLTYHRIGDWRDSPSLKAAGLRVAPKSHMLVWQDAAEKAQTALAAVDRRDFATAERFVNEAVRLYRLYIVNADGREVIQPWMELGELLNFWGEWMQRLDNRNAYINAYSGALEAFANAHALQVRGEGRVIDEEVFRAADVASRLCVRLAEPGNPELDRSVKLGFDLLKFLELRYQAPIGMRYAQLLLVYSTQIRTTRPKDAREGLDRVIRTLDEERQERGSYTKFLRGQAYLYRGAIPPRSREDLERAYRFFGEVAKEKRDLALRATFLSARACCTIGKVFEDKAMAEKGKAILKKIPELSRRIRVRISGYLASQVTNEVRTCVVR